ncbi:MAG: hypothetical protein J1F01_02250 [Oscillospiraceae bacterium]|nr:hypothetical protein [Oscillospiraceae bacterium]
MKSKLFKKVVAAVSAVSMLASMAFVIPASAAWTAPQYGAADATYSGTTDKLTKDKESTVDGEPVKFDILGYVAGGVSDATVPDNAGTATFKVNVTDAGDYDVMVTVYNPNKRRVDLQVGTKPYLFSVETGGDYMSAWTLLNNDAKPLATYTFENVSLEAGDNDIVVGTNNGEEWAPDLVGIDVTAASADDDTPGTDATDAPGTDATDAPDTDATDAPDTDEPKVGIVYADGTVTVTVDDEELTNAVLINAQYDGTTLESVSTYDLTFTDGVATQALAGAVNGSKLMVWTKLSDEDGSLKPVCGAIDVTGGVEATPKPTVEATPEATPDGGGDTTPTEAPTEAPTIEPTEAPPAKEYIYERGIKTAWSNADLEDWTHTGDASGKPTINADHGLYCDTNMTSSVTKTFDISDNAVVTYEAEFYVENSTGRDSNYAYLKFGSALTFGYNSTYNLFYSLDGGATYKTPAIVNSAKGKTLKIVAVINTSANRVISVSIDGTEIAALTNANIAPGATYNSVTEGFVRAGSVNWNTLYGLKSIGVSEEIDDTVYVLVTYNVDGKITTESLAQGGTVAEIPNTDKLGYIFDGWKVGDTEEVISTEALAQRAISADTTFTAQYHLNPEYVQSIAKVEFIDAEGKGILPRDVKAYKYPTELGAIDYHLYEIKVTSDTGDDITADCEITWTAVGGGGEDANYFNLVEKKDDDDESAIVASKRYTRMVQSGESWFGYIKVDVTYDPANSDDESKNTTGTAQIPCAALESGTVAGQIMPAAGYRASMDYYVDDIVGYVATSDDYSYGFDPVLNNWCIVGSNPARDLVLVKEAGKKALKFTNTGGNRGGSSSSCVGTYAFPQQSAQYVFETIVKFEGATRIGVWDKTPNNGGAVAEWAVSFDGDSSITAGEGKITGIDKTKWYKLVVTSDPASKLYSVYAYEEDGTPVGSITDVAGGAAGKFLCVDYGFPIYFNSLRAYVPTLDTISITSDVDVVAVPEAGATNEVALRAICKTADGMNLTGAVEWSLAEEYDGVELVKGTQTATLKISENASGTIKVTASMSGKSAEKEITITSSKNRVAFTTKTSSITIPFEGSPAATGEFLADTITPDSPNGTNDTDIEYTFLDKTGAVALEPLPNGITSSVDPDTNRLTISVAAGATPAVFYVKATQKSGDGLSAKTQVNVHGLSYSFGTDEVEGDTQVTSKSLYTETLGYGFESTTGLTDAADKVTGTAAYKFKAKVPNGNYKVTVNTTSASMQAEIIDEANKLDSNANVAGITKSGENFNVAVCDGVLDLTFAANSSVTSLSIAQIAPGESRDKPKIYAVGDSTTQNENGALSWGSYTARNASIVPERFSSFSNNGKSGANSISFYDNGLMEAILLDIREGDYVTVNMGVNTIRDSKNDSNVFEMIVDQYFVQAIIDRGGIPVITTSTPVGYNSDPTKGWTETSDGKINCNRGTGARNGILRKLAQKYELNIIELSYYGEDYINRMLTELDVDEYNSANGTEYTSTLEIVRSWWADHNHYKEQLGKVLAEYMMGCLDTIASGKDDFSYEKDPHISEQ